MFINFFLTFWIMFFIDGSDSVLIKTRVGEYLGVLDKNVEFGGNVLPVNRFLGIPFAKPPVGSRRFKRPEVPDVPTGVYNATYFRPHCAQIVSNNGYVKYFQRDEDCLYLNVYVPGNSIDVGKKLPVMIWIFGGSFVSGGADVYAGDILSAFNDVIVVTFNYRVDVFGFLSVGTMRPGNFGLWDQRLAIEWVHNNIAEFGGNANMVTLFGESAGAASVIYQALHFGKEKLFHRIIAQSGSVLAPWAFQRAPSSVYVEFVKRASCNKGELDSTMECLRGKTTDEILSYLKPREAFLPTVDGDFLKEDPVILFGNKTDISITAMSHFADLDFLSGVNSDDGVFVILNAWAQVLSRFFVDLSNGVPKSFFYNTFVPQVLQSTLFIKNPLVTKAVLYKYTDWSDEYDTVKVRTNMMDMTSDILFFVPALSTADKHSDGSVSKSTYFYEFSHKSWFDVTPDWVTGAHHGYEIPYVFGLPDSFKVVLMMLGNITDVRPADDINLSRMMMKMWTNFAKTGNPNSPSPSQDGFPDWPMYTSDYQPYFQFSTNITAHSIKNRLAAARFKFWTELVPAIQDECQDMVAYKETSTLKNPASGAHHEIGQIYIIMFLLIGMYYVM